MSEHTINGGSSRAWTYEIRLKGHLDDRWADWFEGLSFTPRKRRHNHLHRPGGRSGRVVWLAEESA